MKICFIATQGGEFGGSEVLWYMTAKVALIKGVNVLISAHHSYLKHAQLKELVNLGAKLHIRCDAKVNTIQEKLRFKIKCFIPTLNGFAEVKQFKPDIVVVSQRGTYDAASQLMLYRFLVTSNLPFILISQFHVEHKAKLGNLIKQRINNLFELARRVYFVSKRNKIASETSIGRNINNAYVINNPIKLEVDDLEWPNENVFNIACVARINFEIKRQDLLINILALKKWRERNLKLNLYGDGSDSSNLQNIIQDKSLDGFVTFKGHVEDIKKIWQHNHLLVLPSVAEGLPLALIEANLFGRAAITTRVGDNERLVLPDETGFLIDDLSVQALDNALENAWLKRAEWKKLGHNSRAHAMQSLDINIHKTLLSQLINLINE
jgi:L-malate glycosyltransferase